MKVRISLCIAMACLAGAVSSTQAAILSSGVVYEVSVAGTIVFPQPISEDTNVVGKTSFTTSSLINLAQGRPLTNAVPANEKLAVELFFSDSDKPTGQLAVYDMDGGTNLAVIADLDLSGALATKTGKGIVAMAGTINPVGALSDGWVAMTGKAVVNETAFPPLVAFSSTGVQGVLRGFDGETFFDVIIAKAKAKFLGTIGSVPAPTPG